MKQRIFAPHAARATAAPARAVDGVLEISQAAVVAAAGFSISHSFADGIVCGGHCTIQRSTIGTNGAGGPDVLPLLAPAHPTSGFFNLCIGVPGPAPTCP